MVGMQDDKGRWNQFTGKYPWDESCVCSDHEAYGGTGNKKEGAPFEAAPNVDHTNERVRQVLCTQLNHRASLAQNKQFQTIQEFEPL